MENKYIEELLLENKNLHMELDNYKRELKEKSEIIINILTIISKFKDESIKNEILNKLSL